VGGAASLRSNVQDRVASYNALVEKYSAGAYVS
jgi:hypothetical protein